MPEPLILALDAGTSALKACLYTQDGRALAATSASYGYRTPQPGWAEGDPAAWWAALVAAVRGLAEKVGDALAAVRMIGVTGQMHSAVLLDEQGDVIEPTMLWLDRRAAAEAAELAAALKLPPYWLNSSYTLPRLVWLHRHRPDVVRRVARVLWPKDYLRWRLTGEMATDATEAAGAALWDYERQRWAVERLAYAGLSPAVLPPVRGPEEVAGALLPAVAAELGLPEDADVIVGAGDVIALLAGAPPDPGILSYSLGSSSMTSVLLAPGQQADDPQGRIYLYRIGPHRLLNAVSSTTGAAWQWAAQTLTGEAGGVAEGFRLAAEAPPGAEGLIFLPYLAGERSPFWSDTLRGGYLGLALHHGRSHLLRAALEGVGLSLRLLLDIYTEAGVTPDRIALSGGGARAPLWAQIIADTCQLPALVYAAEETVTRPLYAWCATRLEPGLSFEDALRRTFGEPTWRVPDTSLAPMYAESFSRYREAAEFLSRTSKGKDL